MHNYPTHLSHNCLIPIIPIMFLAHILCMCENFHIMNIDVLASVGALPLDTQYTNCPHDMTSCLLF